MNPTAPTRPGLPAPVILGPCTLYCGDSANFIDTLQPDAVVTDPPYGINACRDRNCKANGWKDYGSTGWDDRPVDPALLNQIIARNPRVAIWGGNYFTLPPSMGWLVWDKGQRDFSLADGELAWTNTQQALRIFTLSRARALLDGKVHPTQKPVALMAWTMDRLKISRGEIVADFFMGSGTTGIACIRTGRKFVGIEKHPEIFKTACERIARELDGMLPLVADPDPLPA